MIVVHLLRSARIAGLMSRLPSSRAPQWRVDCVVTVMDGWASIDSETWVVQMLRDALSRHSRRRCYDAFYGRQLTGGCST
jgi:hypothetical protein